MKFNPKQLVIFPVSFLLLSPALVFAIAPAGSVHLNGACTQQSECAANLTCNLTSHECVAGTNVSPGNQGNPVTNNGGNGVTNNGNGNGVTNTHGNSVTNTGNSVTNTGGETSLHNPLNNVNSLEDLLTAVLGAVISLGTIALVVALVWVGAQFVFAQGQEEKIRDARNALMWTVIGGLVLLGAQAISMVIQSTVGALQ